MIKLNKFFTYKKFSPISFNCNQIFTLKSNINFLKQKSFFSTTKIYNAIENEDDNQLDEEEFLKAKNRLKKDLDNHEDESQIIDVENNKRNSSKIKKKKTSSKEDVMSRLNSKWVEPSTNIILIDETGKRLGTKTYGEARKYGFSKNMRIERVNEDPSGLMIYRVMSSVKVENKKEKTLSSSEMDYKEIRFSVMISDHDVEFKENKINELISEGYPVKLIVFQKKAGNVPFERELSVAIIKNILDRIDKSVASHQSINVEDNKQETSTFILPHQLRPKRVKQPSFQHIPKKK
eukprot:TRINITY_DN17136_c0_g1_i1.p1 TRINITY_DN17136_c0_g1~~TRINITY_DN17136_c0_g1_i1.p1  ORF type:complete len:292 (+),score=87.35 TRINITY_DN17136_c0_g1_i1:34-909(+)